MKPCAPSQRKQVNADRNDIFADLARREVALSQDLEGDEVYLAEVRGRGGDVHAGAVLDVWGY